MPDVFRISECKLKYFGKPKFIYPCSLNHIRRLKS